MASPTSTWVMLICEAIGTPRLMATSIPYTLGSKLFHASFYVLPCTGSIPRSSGQLWDLCRHSLCLRVFSSGTHKRSGRCFRNSQHRVFDLLVVVARAHSRVHDRAGHGYLRLRVCRSRYAFATSEHQASRLRRCARNRILRKSLDVPACSNDPICGLEAASAPWRFYRRKYISAFSHRGSLRFRSHQVM